MKEVAECCFQQLYGELVRSMVRPRMLLRVVLCVVRLTSS